MLETHQWNRKAGKSRYIMTTSVESAVNGNSVIVVVGDEQDRTRFLNSVQNHFGFIPIKLKVRTVEDITS